MERARTIRPMAGRRDPVPVAAPGADTVTFLFSDVEGSTRLLEEDLRAADRALMRHHELMEAAVTAAGGAVFETVGDAVYAAFPTPASALSAAVGAQRAMLREDWSRTGIPRRLRIRVAVHRGPVERRGHRYFGTPLFAAARLLGLANGDQTLVSDDVAAAVAGALPVETRLRSLGRHRLKDLGSLMVVHQLEGSGMPEARAPIRSLGVVHLPGDLDRFVGRTSEIDRVRSILLAEQVPMRPRLLTLVGPGGTGKTRLAIEAARGLGDGFLDGVWWVPLAAVSDPAFVLPAIGTAVGASGDVGHHLQTWSALIVLDNVEQVITCAARVAELLRRCPGVRILATSREPLRISGEAVLPVDPLDADGCVQLLRERTLAVAPTAAIEGATAERICRLLDHLPLAVELAAARLRVLTPDQLLARLADRLDAVGDGMRDRPERQRSLRSTIAWSADLLEPDERAAFEHLSVFVGGWDLDAAEAVVGIDADRLEALVDRSLVRREPGGRFTMLETIRAFAREGLDRRDDVTLIRDRHAAWFGSLASRLFDAVDNVVDGADAVYLDTLDRDTENLWEAMRWIAGGRPIDDPAHRVVTGTWRYWIWRGRGRRLLQAVRDLPWAGHPYTGGRDHDARSGIAELARYFGDHRFAVELKEAELLDPTTSPAMAAALHADLAELRLLVGEPEDAARHAAAAVHLRRRIHDPRMVAHAMCARMGVEFALGRHEDAVASALEALAILRAHPDSPWLFVELASEVVPVLVRGGAIQPARLTLLEGLRAAGVVRSDLTLALLIDGASGVAERAADDRIALRWATVAESTFARLDDYRPSRRCGTDVLAAFVARDPDAVSAARADARDLPLEAIADEVRTWLQVTGD